MCGVFTVNSEGHKTVQTLKIFNHITLCFIYTHVQSILILGIVLFRGRVYTCFFEISNIAKLNMDTVVSVIHKDDCGVNRPTCKCGYML